MMIGDAGEVHGPAVPAPGLQLTPTSGLALGVALSIVIWAAAAETVHLLGIF